MRIWYVEEGGTSASRNASCDLSAADDTRRFNTLAADECAPLSTARRPRSVGGLGLAPRAWAGGRGMRFWYVEKGGASAPRNASCDLSAADDTRRFNALAADECAPHSRRQHP